MSRDKQLETLDKSDPVEATACRPTPHSNKLVLKIKQHRIYCCISIDAIINIIYFQIIQYIRSNFMIMESIAIKPKAISTFMTFYN